MATLQYQIDRMNKNTALRLRGICPYIKGKRCDMGRECQYVLCPGKEGR